MINHIRTLLLNRSADYFTNSLYTEYIPPAYTPYAFDSELQRVRDLLIPVSLDATSENLIVASILSILDAPDLAEYSSQFDTRITYDLSDIMSSLLTDSSVTVDFNKSSTCDLAIKYKLDVIADPIERGLNKWTLTRNTGSSLLITYNKRNTPLVVPVTFLSGNRTNDINLLGEYLRVYFTTPSLTLTGSFNATINAVVAPAYNIGAVFGALKTLLADPKIFGRVFRTTGNDNGAVTELRDIYTASIELPVLFGSLVLAYVWQCQQLAKVS